MYENLGLLSVGSLYFNNLKLLISRTPAVDTRFFNTL